MDEKGVAFGPVSERDEEEATTCRRLASLVPFIGAITVHSHRQETG